MITPVQSPCARLEVVTHGGAQTFDLGARIAPHLRPGDVLPLWGDFGSGKTTFAQGVAQGLGIASPVVSPSFGLVHEYRAPAPFNYDLYHLDLYRIESLAEALAFGVDELLGGDNVCLVEWPDAAADALPGDRLEVWFEHVGEHNRSLKFRALGERAAHTLTHLQASLPSGY